VKKKYHNIYSPLIDTIELAGPDILKEFEAKSKDDNNKNLLVLPREMIGVLGRSKKQGSFGAEDFLRALDEVRINEAESTENYNVYNMMDRLDVAFVKGVGLISDYSAFEKRINEFWEAVDNDGSWGNRPKFISNDSSVRVDLKDRGLAVDKPGFLLHDESIVKKGVIVASNKFAEKIFSSPKGLSLDEAVDLLNPVDGALYPNQFVKIRGDSPRYARVVGDLKRSSNGKIIGYDNPRVVLLNDQEYNKKVRVGSVVRDNVLGVSAWDMEQYLAFQYGLFNDDVELFFMTGGAGSGKTLLSYVSVIDQVLWYDSSIAKARGYGVDGKGEQVRYKFKQIVLLKPNNLIGKDRDIGFLPGSMYDKLESHLMPFIDAHEECVLDEFFGFEDLLSHPKRDTSQFKKRPDIPKINGEAYLSPKLPVFRMTYSGVMRGRSFSDTMIVVDEGENFTPYEMKTICGRVGMGSKLLVLGDPAQIDNPLCTRDVNGLTHAIKHYLPMAYSALIHLPKNYRSQLSEDSNAWNVYSH